MKEISATSRNLSLVYQDGPAMFTPMVEAILVLSEPQYSVDLGGQLVRTRQVETVRFATSPEGLRDLARTFLEWADDADNITPKAGRPAKRAKP
jgi:hypothetical protein